MSRLVSVAVRRPTLLFPRAPTLFALGLLLVPSTGCVRGVHGSQVVSPVAPKDPTAPVVAQTSGPAGTPSTGTSVPGATGSSISIDLRDASASGDAPDRCRSSSS